MAKQEQKALFIFHLFRLDIKKFCPYLKQANCFAI